MAARIPTHMGQRHLHADILTLTQWLSPSYPVGAFAYSHGLETVISDQTVTTAIDVQNWLRDVLAHGGGRNDCILLNAAYKATSLAQLRSINATALANAASAERVKETQLQGAAFCKTTAAIWGDQEQSLVYPVAVGAAANRKRIDPILTASMFAQAFISNLVSVAVRAVPLGQTEGQAVLAALNTDCERIAVETHNASLDDLQSTAFLSDIAAMKHETLPVRIFRS